MECIKVTFFVLWKDKNVHCSGFSYKKVYIISFFDNFLYDKLLSINS